MEQANRLTINNTSRLGNKIKCQLIKVSENDIKLPNHTYPLSIEPVALVHGPAAVSMFASGFALICKKGQAIRVKNLRDPPL